jgi:hypothetical protein
MDKIQFITILRLGKIYKVAKKKCADIKEMQRKTGGGNSNDVPSFRPHEEVVLDLISKASKGTMLQKHKL